MKKIQPLIILLLAAFISMNAGAQTFSRTSEGIVFTSNNLDIQIGFYSPEIIRVVKSPAQRQFTKESLSVIKTPQNVKISTRQQGDVVHLRSSMVHVAVNLKTGKITFSDLKGNVLLNEKESGVSFVDFNDAGEQTFTVKQAFVLDPEEPIYGLGILQNGKMSQRNQTKYLIQGNVEDVVTFFQSVKGYGLFWDNYSPTNFADNQAETSFESEVGDCIDYYFMYGKNADGVVAQMRDLTGQVPMFPLWTYGYWQSRERYKSQEELLEVVRKHRELGVPLDGIIQDWQYWGSNYLWNAMEFLNAEFPNPRRMIDEVHAMNANIIISIWSSFGPMTKQYRELKEKGMLFDIGTWPQSGVDRWPPNRDYPSGVKVYDPYHPEARAIYWKYLKRMFDMNIDGWWMDSTEPDHHDFKPEDMDTKTYLGSFRKVRNAFPLMTVGGVYKNQRAVSSDKRVFILTRSGFAGQQRYGANVWSGDVGSSWESLRNQIPAGLNFTLTGNPNFNTDIGGFFSGAYNKAWNDGTAPKNPLFQELYVRWMQYGAFSPMMRSHGTDIKREIYYFGQKGEPIYDAIESAIHLRYSLLPYIYSTSWEVTNQQSSFMRALVMDFPNDKKVWDMNNQFMFGKSILVAPIVNAQYTPEKIVKVDESTGWDASNNSNEYHPSRVDFLQKKTTSVYLPEGADWYDFATNERFAGGQEIMRESTIDFIPLFIKAGSILPIGPKVQFVTEKSWENLEIRIYAGANGSFTLYEDEFDNYNYENGAFTEIPMTWNNASRTLTIGARKGAYNGMLENRTFKVVLQDRTQQTVNYSGKRIVVSFR